MRALTRASSQKQSPLVAEGNKSLVREKRERGHEIKKQIAIVVLSKLRDEFDQENFLRIWLEREKETARVWV